METYKAAASIVIDAPVDQVWKTLTDPKAIKQYLFGADVHTTWEPGSAISYTGEYEGKAYEEKGKIVQFEPNRLLQTTNLSSMSGLEDKPENYDLVTYRVEPESGSTRLTIEQQNQKSQQSVDGSKDNWKMVLELIKRQVENGNA